MAEDRLHRATQELANIAYYRAAERAKALEAQAQAARLLANDLMQQSIMLEFGPNRGLIPNFPEYEVITNEGGNPTYIVRSNEGVLTLALVLVKHINPSCVYSHCFHTARKWVLSGRPHYECPFVDGDCHGWEIGSGHYALRTLADTARRSGAEEDWNRFWRGMEETYWRTVKEAYELEEEAHTHANSADTANPGAE